ncbi:hypothetical protein VPH35_032563 [Triticum aestivum]|uniref:Phytocyanin domain-containing protein n=1 Tax=Triticum turgidum subsp. durum TaxID=4567 RepID=A0A9R1Q1X7_TRITD|nr:unnamed protein product [Triticum turgidum subsp. durum]
MAATRTILLAVTAMAILSTASAAIYNVGEPGGAWDLSTNYGTWASSRNFHPNDQIIFKYSPQAHDVLEVKIDVVPSSSSSSPAPASGPSASNAPPPTPVSAATSMEATGFGLTILLAVAGLMA